MNGQAVQLVNPGTIAADIIGSAKMQEQWETQYKSRADQNPARKYADEIKALLEGQENWKDVLADNPELLVFMRKFIEIERGALHSRVNPRALPSDLQTTQRGFDIIAAQLNAIEPKKPLPQLEELPDGWRKFLKPRKLTRNFFSAAFPPPAIPKEKHLSDDMREVLNIERFHTAQNSFRPVRSAASYAGKFGAHLAEEIWEHKTTAIPMGLIFASLTSLMMSNMGMPTARFTEEDATIQACSMEDFMAGRQGDECLDTTPMVLTEIYGKGGCHGHIAPLVYGHKGATNFLVDKTPIPKLLGGKDCPRADDLAEKTRNALQTGIDANLNRHNQTAGKPVARALEGVERIGLRYAKDPEETQKIFRDRVNNTIEGTVDGINKYDVMENFVLHFGIYFLSGFGGAYAGALGRRPRAHHFQSIGKKASNTWNRLKKNAPITTTATAIAAGYPAITDYLWQGGAATGSFNPNVILYGLAAGLGASAVQKGIRYTKRREHVREMTTDVQGQLTALANTHTADVKAPKLSHKKSLWRPAISTAFGAVAGYGLVVADFALNHGQATATTIGTAGPIGLFLPSNGFTDVALHYGFAIAGGATGGAFGYSARGTVLAPINAFRSKEKRIPFWAKAKNDNQGYHVQQHL